MLIVARHLFRLFALLACAVCVGVCPAPSLSSDVRGSAEWHVASEAADSVVSLQNEVADNNVEEVDDEDGEQSESELTGAVPALFSLGRPTGVRASTFDFVRRIAYSERDLDPKPPRRS